MKTRRNATLPVPEGRHYQAILHVRLAELCLERGLVHTDGRHKGKINIHKLHLDTGISYPTLHKAITRGEHDYFGLHSLGRLCEYFNVGPGELLRLVVPTDTSAYTRPQAPVRSNGRRETVLSGWD